MLLSLVIHLSQNMFFMSLCLAYFRISFELVERRMTVTTSTSHPHSLSLCPCFLTFLLLFCTTFVMGDDDDDIVSCRVLSCRVRVHKVLHLNMLCKSPVQATDTPIPHPSAARQ